MTTGNSIIDDVVNTDKPLEQIFERVDSSTYPELLKALEYYDSLYGWVDRKGNRADPEKPLMDENVRKRFGLVYPLLLADRPIDKESLQMQQDYNNRIKEIADKRYG